MCAITAKQQKSQIILTKHPAAYEKRISKIHNNSCTITEVETKISNNTIIK